VLDTDAVISTNIKNVYFLHLLTDCVKEYYAEQNNYARGIVSLYIFMIFRNFQLQEIVQSSNEINSVLRLAEVLLRHDLLTVN
jgi:hypothetical protein